MFHKLLFWNIRMHLLTALLMTSVDIKFSLYVYCTVLFLYCTLLWSLLFSHDLRAVFGWPLYLRELFCEVPDSGLDLIQSPRRFSWNKNRERSSSMRSYVWKLLLTGCETCETRDDTDGFETPTFCKAWGGLSTVYFCVLLLLNQVKVTISRFSKAKSADQVLFWYSVTRTNEPSVSTQTRECTFAMEGLLCVKKIFSRASKHRTDWIGKRVTSLEKNPTSSPKN